MAWVSENTGDRIEASKPTARRTLVHNYVGMAHNPVLAVGQRAALAG